MDEHPRRWKQYQKILFDMDGVITSERQYWTAAALTVMELFFDEELNVAFCEEESELIVQRIFHNDETIKVLKSLGVNTNWDLAYLTFMAAAVQKAEGEPDDEIWEAVFRYFKELDVEAPELYEYVAEVFADLYHYPVDTVRRSGELWRKIQDVFQQWYLGDSLYEEAYGCSIQTGKTGLVHKEQPLLPLEQVDSLLRGLKERGYFLGIGTGRNTREMEGPLKAWDIYDLFDIVVTYDTVEEAQKNCGGLHLAKPHPYVFLKGALGMQYSDRDIAQGIYELKESVLVVGDAGADILAAKQGNMDFAAVLTGVSGEEAYGFFKERGADYILENVLGLDEILE